MTQESRFENLSIYDKPLVSPTTVHGMWIKNMIKQGFQISDIDSAIDNYLSLKGIIPIKELSQQEKKRGKRKYFENGTIAVVEGKIILSSFYWHYQNLMKTIKHKLQKKKL